MRILLDVDGPCADFVGHLIVKAGLSLTPADVKQWQLLDLLGHDDRERALDVLHTQDFWTSLPVVDGAREGVLRMRQGNEIVFVTSSWLTFPSWEFVRRNWLSYNFDGTQVDDIIIAGRKDIIEGDVFIDDKASHVEAWAKAHPMNDAFLFTMPHNVDSPWPWRFTWERNGHYRNL